MNNMRVLAVVVTYNRKELLQECLQCLRRQSFPCEILVVDNASTDGTGEWLQENSWEGLFYHNTGSNLGGAGGFSVGIREGVRRGASHLWILDDDTMPEPDALERLMTTGEYLAGQYGFLSSFVRWTDGSPCQMNIPRVSPSWWEDMERLPQGLLRLESTSFVSLLVPVAVVREVGLPISQFVIWGDDMEYTLRISRMHPCYFVADSRVVHKMKSNVTTNILVDDPERLDRYRLMFRNRYFIERQKGRKEAIKYQVYGIKTIFRILKHPGRYKGKKIRCVISGFWRGLWFHPTVEFCPKEGEQ